MGLSESKMVTHTIRKACTDAETGGKDEITTVLSDPEFVRALRQLWASIPLDTRKIIVKRPSKSQKSSQGTTKGTQESTFIVAPDLLADIPNWENTPESFFEEAGNAFDSASFGLAQFYRYLETLEKRRTKDTIRSRFIKVSYHRLTNRLCLEQLRTKGIESMAEIIITSGMVTHDKEEIKQHIYKWAKEGKRIDELCRDLSKSKSADNSHLGYLFCLPPDIHDEYIRTLPLAGEARDVKIIQLRNRDFLDIESKQRLDGLANKIFGLLWKVMERAISRICALDGSSDWETQLTQSFRVFHVPLSKSNTRSLAAHYGSSTPNAISTAVQETEQMTEQRPHNSSPQSDEGHIQVPSTWYLPPSQCHDQAPSAQVTHLRQSEGYQGALQSFSSRHKEAPTATYTRQILPDMSSAVTSPAPSNPADDAMASRRAYACSLQTIESQASTGSRDFSQKGNQLKPSLQTPGQPHGQSGVNDEILFNIHENAQPMLLPHLVACQDIQSEALGERSFSLFEDVRSMSPVLQYHSSHEGQRMTGMEEIFNIHENAQSMHAPQYIPQFDGQFMMSMTRPQEVFDIHENAQPMPPWPLFSWHDSECMAVGTFNLHENAQPMPELEYFDHQR